MNAKTTTNIDAQPLKVLVKQALIRRAEAQHGGPITELARRLEARRAELQGGAWGALTEGRREKAAVSRF